MKHLGLAVFALLTVSIQSWGALFMDTLGDAPSLATTTYDIKSVEVTHTASQLVFRVDMNANAANFMRYLISIDSKPSGFGGGAGNWVDSIKTTQLNDYFLVGCLDGQLQGTLWSRSVDTWTSTDIASNVSRTSSSFTFTLDRQDLGLADGTTIKFDVFASDGALNSVPKDALSSTALIGDITQYSSPTFFTYQLSNVPEPAHYGLFCAAGLIGVSSIQRLRSRKAIPSKS
jgi:hypothetical protein